MNPKYRDCLDYKYNNFDKEFDIVNLHCTLDYCNKEFGNDFNRLNYLLENKYKINISKLIINELSFVHRNDNIKSRVYLFDMNYNNSYLLPTTYKRIYDIDFIIKSSEKYHLLPLSFDKHATVVLYQKINDKIIDFKLFNTGKEINNHDKDIDTKKFKAYFNIVFDISNNLQKQNLQQLMNTINILNITPIDNVRSTNLINTRHNKYKSIYIIDDNYNTFYKLLKKIKSEINTEIKTDIKLIDIDNGNNDKIFQKILLNFIIKDNDIFINPQKSGSCTFYSLMISYLYICLQNNDLYIDFKDKYLNMYINIIKNFVNNVNEYINFTNDSKYKYYLYNDIYYDKNNLHLSDTVHLDLNEVFQISLIYINIIKKFNIFGNDEELGLIDSYNKLLIRILNIKQENKLYYNNFHYEINNLKQYNLDYDHNLFIENTIQVNESIIELENVQNNNLQSNILYISNLHKNLIDNIENNNDKNIYINYEKLFEYEINYILEITIENFLRKEDKYFELIGDFNILDYYFTDNISYILIIYIYYIYHGSKKRKIQYIKQIY